MNVTLRTMCLLAPLVAVGCGSDSDSSVQSLPTNPAGGSSSYIQLGSGNRGNGSLTSPYNSLQQAVDAAPEGAELVVVASSDNTPVQESVALKNGQRLTGQAAASAAQGSARRIASGTYPRISGTITLANGNVVSGLEIVSPAGDAITGNGVNSADINNVKVTDAAGSAVRLLRASGNLRVADCEFGAKSGQSAADLIQIRTDENAGAETRGSSSTAAADTSITITNNLLSGNSFTANGLLIGSDETAGSSNRPSTRIRSVELLDNSIVSCAEQGLRVDLQAEPASMNLVHNSTVFCNQGIWVRSVGPEQPGQLTLVDNRTSTKLLGLRVDVDHDRTASIRESDVRLNPAFGSQIPPTEAVSILPVDEGTGILAASSPGSRVDLLFNTISGGGKFDAAAGQGAAITVLPGFYPDGDASTGYTRVNNNRFLFNVESTTNEIYVGVLSNARVSVRGTNSSRTLLKVDNTTNPSATVTMSILNNQLFNYFFNLLPSNHIVVENSGVNGDALLSNSGAGNVKADTADVVIRGGTLEDLPFSESNIPY